MAYVLQWQKYSYLQVYKGIKVDGTLDLLLKQKEIVEANILTAVVVGAGEHKWIYSGLVWGSHTLMMQ